MRAHQVEKSWKSLGNPPMPPPPQKIRPNPEIRPYFLGGLALGGGTLRFPLKMVRVFSAKASTASPVKCDARGSDDETTEGSEQGDLVPWS